MKKHAQFLAGPATARAFLSVFLAGLAIAPMGCGKKAAAPPLAQQSQAASAENNQPLVGEVDPEMTRQLLVFIQQQGHPPTNFAEFARARLDRVPRTPAGKAWAIDYSSKEVKLVAQ